LRSEKICPVRPANLVYEFGVKRGTAERMLNRLSEAGVVPKISRGLWWNPFYPPPNPLCLHRTIASDSYVSLLTALWYHGIIHQRPFVVTCVRWAGRSFVCRNEYGEYQFTRIPRKLVFGVKEVEGHGFAVAEPEKAFLDHLYVSRFVEKRHPRLVELDLEGLDPDKLKRYAARMGARMLRYLCETGLDDPRRWPGLAPVVL